MKIRLTVRNLLIFLLAYTFHTVLVSAAENTDADEQISDEVFSEAIEPDLPVLASSSPATAENQVSAAQTLQAEASYIDNTAAGMCEVVNGILGDYCTSNPDDVACQTLLQ